MDAKTQPPTWGIKIRGVFQMGAGGWKVWACTPTAVMLR